MKIAIVSPDDFSVWIFYKGLVTALKNEGADVYVISTSGPYVRYLEQLGAIHIAATPTRFATPVADLRFLIQLYRVFAEHRFDIVHSITMKMSLFGALAGRLAGVGRIVSVIDGLGFVYTPGVEGRVATLRPLVHVLNRLTCALSHKVWFMNPDDRDTLTSAGIVPGSKAVVIRSAGINTTEYSPEAVSRQAVERLRQELGADESTRIVIMVAARMVWCKGVKEFVEAAEIVSNRCPFALFVLVGPVEPDSPMAVPVEYLEARTSPRLRWLGFRNDVRDLYALSSVLVLPSYYREGVPNVLLEAMAMGKAVITTDNVGCRETVEEGRNGCLVPVKSPQELADAIEQLIRDDEKLRRFGEYSRLKIQREFSESFVAGQVMARLYEMAPAPSVA